MKALLSSSAANLIHDPEYYIAEGNTVLRVEDTLFKVHRYLLSRDGSAFEGMFALDHIRAGPVEDSEGDSDENPIVLHGDKPEEFRALLWSLYALPAEVFQMPSTQTDVIRFIQLARVAHKYSFRTTENWALHVLTVCQTNPDAMTPANTTPILTQLTEVAILCNHEELHEAVEPMWADLLFTGQTDDIVSAMTVADKLNLRPLLGLAYYLMMLKGREEWNNPNLKSAMTREQKVRLLSGYYNLSRACETLPTTAPTLIHHPTCFMQARCGEAWQALWATMIHKMMNEGGSPTLRIQSVDLLRKLHLANHLLEKVVNGEAAMDVPGNMNRTCLRNGLKASEDKVNDVLYGLADCFVEGE